MQVRKAGIILGIFLMSISTLLAQTSEKDYPDKKKPKIQVKITAGPEVNLTIPTDFGTRKDLYREDTVFKFLPQIRFRLGACVRFDFSKTFSLQTGIYYVSRQYKVLVGKTNGQSPDITQGLYENRINFVGYEIPIMGLFYVQLGEKWFLNNAVGFSLDMFPSHTQEVDPLLTYEIYNARRGWIIPSIKASVGFEFRTTKTGYFYLGGQFHRPLIPISDMYVERTTPDGIGYQTVSAPMSGTYFAVDLKYFFNPGPGKRE